MGTSLLTLDIKEIGLFLGKILMKGILWLLIGRLKLCAHPERQSTLVANTLWNTYSDMQAVQSMINTTAHGGAYLFGTWGSAVSNLFYVHDSSGKPIDNWHHRSLGYLFGISTHSLDDHSFCLAAGQLLGNRPIPLLRLQKRPPI